MYEYYWGYTIAQIELAGSDAPFIAYKAKDKLRPGQPGFKSDPEKIKRDVARYEERKKNRKFRLENFLGGKKSGIVNNINNKDGGS